MDHRYRKLAPYDQKVAPLNPLCNLGHPVGANLHADIDKNVVARRCKAITQCVSQFFVCWHAALVRNEELGGSRIGHGSGRLRLASEIVRLHATAR
jgi:hypothetical protein